MRSTPLLTLLFAAFVGAQQPNAGNGSLIINGVNGPRFPIIDAAVPLGATTSVVLSGEAQRPVYLAQAPILSPGNLNTSIGILDLPAASLALVLNGSVTTDLTGSLTLNFSIPSTLPTAFTWAYQGAVISVSAPSGARMTAATRILTTAGVFGQLLTLGDNSSALVDLAPHGAELAYYDATYSAVYVNANGSLSFGMPAADFTATPGEFLAQMPRIAPFWADLSPNLGGQISWTLDQTFSVPQFSVSFSGVATFPAGIPVLPVHTFDVSIQATPTGVPAATADIVVSHDAMNGASLYDTVVGISPGANASAITTSQDLSALKVGMGFLGGSNDAIFEFFGGSFVSPGGNAYDLSGATLIFSAISAGSPGAAYFFN